MQVNHYSRSGILSFYELDDEQQRLALIDRDDARELMYVIYTTLDGRGHALPLDMFMRHEGRFNGVYGTSYFDAYGIILSKCGSEAIVAHLVW